MGVYSTGPDVPAILMPEKATPFAGRRAPKQFSTCRIATLMILSLFVFCYDSECRSKLWNVYVSYGRNHPNKRP